ncbi:MAG: hypothetical protein L6V93_22160 [Clostridiales bacterium]|nr:MAG: hypothetical protein L6V93_22160 [Clostridiales bacterium]
MNSPKYHFVTITSFKGSGVHSHPYYTEAEKMGRELAENINAVAESYDIWQDGKIPQEKTLLDTADKNVYIGGKSGAENAGEYVTLLPCEKQRGRQQHRAFRRCVYRRNCDRRKTANTVFFSRLTATFQTTSL